MNMARPPRPRSEAQLVRDAGAIVRDETGLTSAKSISREIASRVVSELMRELDGDSLDLALAAIDRVVIGSPFQRLAADPDINTANEFVELQVERVRARCGRTLHPNEEAAERRAILAELERLLAGRYDRQLREA
jgi:hypothetical protein